MRIFLGVVLLLAAACGKSADPSACEKGDDKACQSLCETGKPETQHYCYTARARQVKACAEKDVDCPAACALWKDAVVSETTRFTLTLPNDLLSGTKVSLPKNAALSTAKSVKDS